MLSWSCASAPIIFISARLVETWRAARLGATSWKKRQLSGPVRHPFTLPSESSSCCWPSDSLWGLTSCFSVSRKRSAQPSPARRLRWAATLPPQERLQGLERPRRHRVPPLDEDGVERKPRQVASGHPLAAQPAPATRSSGAPHLWGSRPLAAAIPRYINGWAGPRKRIKAFASREAVLPHDSCPSGLPAANHVCVLRLDA